MGNLQATGGLHLCNKNKDSSFLAERGLPEQKTEGRSPLLPPTSTFQ